MRRTFLVTALFSAALAAGQSISTPLVAVFRDDSQHLQRALGIPETLTVPALDASQPEVVWNSSFNGKSGMVKTATQIWILDETGAVVNSFDAPEGDALFAFSGNGSPGLVFFASTGDVWRVTADGLQGSPMPTGGLFDDVLAIDESSARDVRLVARSGEDFFISRMNFDTGEIITSATLPAVTAAIAIGPSLLLADARGLLLRSAAGRLTRLTTGVDLSRGVHALNRVSADRVRIALQDESYLLRLSPSGDPELTRLPAAAATPGGQQ